MDLLFCRSNVTVIFFFGDVLFCMWRHREERGKRLLVDFQSVQAVWLVHCLIKIAGTQYKIYWNCSTSYQNIAILVVSRNWEWIYVLRASEFNYECRNWQDGLLWPKGTLRANLILGWLQHILSRLSTITHQWTVSTSEIGGLRQRQWKCFS